MSHKYYLSGLRLSPLTLRLGTLVGSLLIIVLGLSLSHTQDMLAKFAGAFLVISGGQIALWALGIRLEILGNTAGSGAADGDGHPWTSSNYGQQEDRAGENDSTGEPSDLSVQRLAYEMRGRILSMAGYLLGEASMEPNDRIRARDEEKLAEAVTLCQQGYELLKKVGGAAEFTALNNLIFYSCVMNDRIRRELLLEMAKRLLRIGQECGSFNFIITACRAILQFGYEPHEKRSAMETLSALENWRQLSDRQRKEIAQYRATFSVMSSSITPNPRPQADG